MSSSRLSLVVVGVLVGLLAMLATLQYRWIAQLSEAERSRLQEGVDQSAADFCEDFDREIARAFAVFNIAQPGSDQQLASMLNDRLIEWKSVATWPEMVQELIVDRSHETEESSLLCFDNGTQSLVRCDWTDDLLPIRRRLHDPRPGVPVIDGNLPGLVLAIREHGPPENETPMQWRPPRDHLVVRFDLDVIAETVLPQLAESHFVLDGDLPYLLEVDRLTGGTIFQTGAPNRARTMDPDAIGRLFGLRSFRGLSGPPNRIPGARRPPPPARRGDSGAGRPPLHQPPPGVHARSEEGSWVLAVRHPKGSLEDVVVKARRRNMAISAVMLLMLGFTAVLMVASTRRARRLARQQMDFVAAVSHELRTPLTAIRSAGQNLADGIIDDPKGIRDYGLLIEREGRRLTEMIGRVLAFAGIRSGRKIYRMEPVNAGEIVRAALEDGSWILEESGFEVEIEIADGLPRVNGDKVALRQVVTNLIDNALKYAADGRWIGIRVGCESGPGDGEVLISVSDHGSGIPKRELASVFEPFRRGAEAGNGIPGSGLGLAVVRSIVEAHGGSIDAASTAGGATFTVRLPAESLRSAEKGDER